MLKLDHLTYLYPETQQQFIYNLQLATPNLVGVFGENGSGKSTLFAMLAGIVPCSGQFSFENQLLSQQAAGQRGISLMFAQHNLFMHLSVERNLQLALPSKQWQRCRPQLLQYCQALGLAPQVLQQLPPSLSTGMQQKIGIIRCLIAQHHLLLLDEALAFLDSSSQTQAIQLLLSYATTQQATILLSSHNPHWLSQYIQTALFIQKGSISFCGAIAEFLHSDDQQIRAYLTKV
jgi:thiamine transport system ATP-binding protein